MSKKLEMKFLTGLRKDFKRHGHYFYKIPDAPMAERFMIPRPFDCFIAVGGRFAGMEAKFLDSAKDKSVTYKQLRETQHKGLSDAIRDGGLAWVFYQIKFGRELRLYFWEYREFCRLVEKYGTEKAKKIPLSVLEGMSHIKSHKNKMDVLEYDLTIFERSWEIAEGVYG